MFARGVCFFLIAVVFFLSGCGGNSRTLYFREPGAAKGPWIVTSSTMVMREGIPLDDVVRDVAAELGMSSDGQVANAYRIELSDDNIFSMRVEKLDEGLWSVHFTDRAGKQRSRESYRAEMEIMGRLDTA